MRACLAGTHDYSLGASVESKHPAATGFILNFLNAAFNLEI